MLKHVEFKPINYTLEKKHLPSTAIQIYKTYSWI